MLEKLTVTYDGSAFYPEETVNLEPNTRYIIQVISQEEQVDRTKGSAWDMLAEMAGAYAAPEDWSEEHDHYLYGTPQWNICHQISSPIGRPQSTSGSGDSTTPASSSSRLNSGKA